MDLDPGLGPGKTRLLKQLSPEKPWKKLDTEKNCKIA